MSSLFLQLCPERGKPFLANDERHHFINTAAETNGVRMNGAAHLFFMIFWITIQALVGYNLVFPLALYMFSRLRGRTRPSNLNIGHLNDYAIIVTAFEQTNSLYAVVDSILKLEYQNFIVYIVADKCDVTNLKFDDSRIMVLRPPETLASNTRSHFYAINHFVRPHDVLTIVDSDNLVDPQYLSELNKCFDRGFVAVQGLRAAKNLDTTYACLDAARDMYYHFYDGKILFHIGSSATLAGSGMAFTTKVYLECLEQQDIDGAGFDKVLQKEIVSRGYRIAFNERAIVYDEKTTHSDQLVKQRARWINTWFKYAGYGWSMLWSGTRNADWNQFAFGIVLLRPPLFLFILTSLLFFFANIWVNATAVLAWSIAFCCFILSFILALGHSRPDRRILRSLVGIPNFIYFQLLALLRIRKANKISVATSHYNETTITDIKN